MVTVTVLADQNNAFSCDIFYPVFEISGKVGVPVQTDIDPAERNVCIEEMKWNDEVVSVNVFFVQFLIGFSLCATEPPVQAGFVYWSSQ